MIPSRPADPDLAATSAGMAKNQAQEADAEADRLFGQIMRGMVDRAQGFDAGRRFRDSIIKPTLPGTPQRERQDRAWQLLAARLAKLAGEAP